MTKIFLALPILISMSGIETAAAQTQDCRYSGRGEMYSMTDGSYSKERSFDLKAVRIRLGAGKFLIRETKTWANGQVETKEFPAPGSVGAFDGSRSFPGGTLVSKGYCPSRDHCFGELIVSSVRGDHTTPVYGGPFTSRYDKNSIRTVTFDNVNGFYVDETLASDAICDWN